MADLTATDILKFDLEVAKATYRLNKLRENPKLVIDAPAKVRAMWETPIHDPFDPNLPMLLRRQAD